MTSMTEGKMFHWQKITKFWLGDENFPERNIFPDKVYPDKMF